MLGLVLRTDARPPRELDVVARGRGGHRCLYDRAVAVQVREDPAQGIERPRVAGQLLVSGPKWQGAILAGSGGPPGFWGIPLAS
jgi:hypothetical protein